MSDFKRFLGAWCFRQFIVTATISVLAMSSYGAVDTALGTSLIEGSIDGVDYVGVRNEPQHRHEFENDQVRIYDVLLPPGYITLYHAHTQDTIYVAVQGAKVEIKSLLGSIPVPTDRPIPSGIVFWNGHSTEPVIHQVTNTDTHAARLVGVELKFEETSLARKPLSGEGLKLRDTYKKIRVYDLELAPGENTGELAVDFSALVIALTEATVESISDKGVRQVSALEPASWAWLNAPGKVTLSNAGTSILKAVIYELP